MLKMRKTVLISMVFLHTLAVAGWAGDNAGSVSMAENYGFVISPGESVEGFASLDGTLGQGDFDIVWFIVLGAGNLNLQVEDLYIMGDIMIASGDLLIGGPASFFDWAISPDYISIDVSCPDFALGYMLMCYYDCPGGFPAGYTWRASVGGDCPVGTWTRYYDWHCDGSIVGSCITHIYADGTWEDDEEYSGTWTLVGDQFTLYYTMGTTYYGTVAPGCTYMDGTMEPPGGGWPGCWWADKTALTSTPASQGGSLDSAGN